MATITVEKVYLSRNQDLELTLLSATDSGMQRVVQNAELHRPGLALTGFFERFASKRIQVLGETEMTYMSRLSPDRLTDVADKVFAFGVPMVIITKGIIPPTEFITAADNHNTAVFSSRLSTAVLVSRSGRLP